MARAALAVGDLVKNGLGARSRVIATNRGKPYTVRATLLAVDGTPVVTYALTENGRYYYDWPGFPLDVVPV